MVVLIAIPRRYLCQEILARRCAGSVYLRGAPCAPGATGSVTAGNRRSILALQPYSDAAVERVAIDIAVGGASLGLAMRLEEDALARHAGAGQHRRHAFRTTQ